MAGAVLAAISANGRFVAFTSDASNLVANDINARRDVFVRDRSLGTTKRVSVGSTGAQGNKQSAQPFISGDGRFVSFTSQASNLVVVTATRRTTSSSATVWPVRPSA